MSETRTLAVVEWRPPFVSYLFFLIPQDTQEVPHHLDQNYNMLQCDLSTVEKKSKDFKVSAIHRHYL